MFTWSGYCIVLGRRPYVHSVLLWKCYRFRDIESRKVNMRWNDLSGSSACSHHRRCQSKALVWFIRGIQQLYHCIKPYWKYNRKSIWNRQFSIPIIIIIIIISTTMFMVLSSWQSHDGRTNPRIKKSCEYFHDFYSRYCRSQGLWGDIRRFRKNFAISETIYP